jgi:hypothetical protein
MSVDYQFCNNHMHPEKPNTQSPFPHHYHKSISITHNVHGNFQHQLKHTHCKAQKKCFTSLCHFDCKHWV